MRICKMKAEIPFLGKTGKIKGELWIDLKFHGETDTKISEFTGKYWYLFFSENRDYLLPERITTFNFEIAHIDPVYAFMHQP